MKIPEDTKTDHRQLLLWLCIAGIVISILSLVINYIIQPEPILLGINYSALAIFIGLAIIIKRGLNLVASQYLVVIISIIFTNVMWYYEHGHYGPVLYLFIFIFAVTIFIWEGRKLIYSTIIILINIFVCLYIEYYYPELLTNYQNDTVRLFDIYASIMMFFILIYALMYSVKKSYSRKYKEALQSDKLKLSFLENINHEVRTPLNAIIGFSSLLNEEDITPEQRIEFLGLIGESNDALLRIIDDILLVSTLESGDPSTKMVSCDLDSIMMGLQKTLKQHLIKNKKVNIELLLSEPNVKGIVETDKIRLQQVFIRLMDNAIKFTDSGKINFGYRVENETILFHVADTGIGIQGKHHEKIFERFYKIEIDKNEVYRGTGIGLFITKKIVESLKGDIWLSSIYGSGTTFYFSIPKIGYQNKV